MSSRFVKSQGSRANWSRNKNSKSKSSKRTSVLTAPAASVQNQSRYNAVAQSDRFLSRQVLSALRRPLNPFPDTWRGILTTDLTGYIATGAVATSGFDVAMNSPFLPWNNGGNSWPNPLTAVGSVIPAGYTSLCASAGPYQSYRVVGSAISVKITVSDPDDVMQVTVGPTVGTSVTTPIRFGQMRASKTALVTGNPVTTITNSISTVEVSGDKPSDIGQTGYSAVYNAVPTFAVYWHTTYATCDGSVTDAPVEYHVVVSYDVIFENPQFDQVLETVKIADQDVFAFTQAKNSLRRAKLLSDEVDLNNAALRAIAAASADSKSSSSSSSSCTLSSSSSQIVKPTLTHKGQRWRLDDQAAPDKGSVVGTQRGANSGSG